MKKNIRNVIFLLGILLLTSCQLAKPKIPVTGITIEPPSIILTLNDWTYITATIQPHNADNQIINWSSSNNDVAYVSTNEESFVNDIRVWYLIVVGIGEAILTATTEDGDFTATCEVRVIEPPILDLTATEISGPETLKINNQGTYTITISNLGEQTATGYQVGLYETNNTIALNTVNGTSLEPGESIDYTIDWTPTSEGTYIIYGYVSWNSDQNNDNNTTNNMTVTVIEKDNDLSATSITGHAVSIFGISLVYTIDIKNTGMNVASEFFVDLMRQGVTEPLDTKNGGDITLGNTASYTLTWEPENIGEYQLYGRVRWDLDEKDTNNETERFNVSIVTGGETTFTVSNITQWEETINTIQNGGDGHNYTINVTNNIEVNPTSDYTFGNVSSITITINGEQTIFLGVGLNGHLLRMGPIQNLIMNDIDFYGHTTNDDPLVSIEGGSLTMLGSSTIAGNSATNIGGVSITNGVFNMRDQATISGNTVLCDNIMDTFTAAVSLNNSTLNMYSGIISHNSVSDFYAGSSGSNLSIISLSNYSTFNMMGGSIFNNNVPDYLDYLTIIGDIGIVILNTQSNFNYTGGTIFSNIGYSNIFVRYSNCTTSNVTIPGTGNGMVAYNGFVNMVNTTISGASTNGILMNDSTINLIGVTISGVGNNGIQIDSGNIDLNNVIISSSTSHGILMNGGTITPSGSLSINNNEVGIRSTSNSARITLPNVVNISNNTGRGIIAQGTIFLSGGTISNNGGGILMESGNFTMSSGTISNNTVESDDISIGGGLVITNGNFTMNGGTISGNTASLGGAVYISGLNATFNTQGGSITRNSSTIGGAIYLDEGTLEVTANGNITGNSSTEDGAGVFQNNGVFLMSGGVISLNESGRNGGGIFVNNGIFTMSGGIVYGVTGPNNNLANNNGASLYVEAGEAQYGNGLPIVPLPLPNFTDNTITYP